MCVSVSVCVSVCDLWESPDKWDPGIELNQQTWRQAPFPVESLLNPGKSLCIIRSDFHLDTMSSSKQTSQPAVSIPNKVPRDVKGAKLKGHTRLTTLTLYVKEGSREVVEQKTRN